MKKVFLLITLVLAATAAIVVAEQPTPMVRDTVILSADSTHWDTLKVSPVNNTPRSNFRGN